MKNDLDVFYFATLVPINVVFLEDGQMDKRVFLQAWKEIPAQNEVQYNINNALNLSPGELNLHILMGSFYTKENRQGSFHMKSTCFSIMIQ